MVSIIIPAYNCERYISQCLDSLLNQNISSIEIIVVDDGSNDGTARILDDYSNSEERLRVFHVQNGGPSRARNIGLSHAMGEWILFVDADDWVDTDILLELDIEENPADITFFGFKKCFEDGSIEKCIPLNVDYTEDKAKIQARLKELFDSKIEYFGYSMNKIFKRSIIEKYKVRFVENLCNREDEIFTLSYCRYISNCRIVSFAPYNYRILNSSLSHNLTIRYRNYRMLIETELEILQSYDMSEFKAVVLGRIFKYYISSIIECIQMNMIEQKKVIVDAISYYHANRKYIEAPKWQKLVFGFPVKNISKYLVNIVFKIRNTKTV